MNEPSLEGVGELQQPAVVVGQTSVPDDRDQPVKVASLGVQGVQLISQRPVVVAGALRADPGIHQPAQRRQHVDRRIDPAAMQVAGSTIWPSVMYPERSGMGCVMSSSGMDRMMSMRDRPGVVVEAPRPLEVVTGRRTSVADMP